MDGLVQGWRDDTVFARMFKLDSDITPYVLRVFVEEAFRHRFRYTCDVSSYTGNLRFSQVDFIAGHRIDVANVGLDLLEPLSSDDIEFRRLDSQLLHLASDMSYQEAEEALYSRSEPVARRMPDGALLGAAPELVSSALSRSQHFVVDSGGQSLATSTCIVSRGQEQDDRLVTVWPRGAAETGDGRSLWDVSVLAWGDADSRLHETWHATCTAPSGELVRAGDVALDSAVLRELGFRPWQLPDAEAAVHPVRPEELAGVLLPADGAERAANWALLDLDARFCTRVEFYEPLPQSRGPIGDWAVRGGDGGRVALFSIAHDGPYNVASRFVRPDGETGPFALDRPLDIGETEELQYALSGAGEAVEGPDICPLAPGELDVLTGEALGGAGAEAIEKCIGNVERRLSGRAADADIRVWHVSVPGSASADVGARSVLVVSSPDYLEGGDTMYRAFDVGARGRVEPDSALGGPLAVGEGDFLQGLVDGLREHGGLASCPEAHEMRLGGMVAELGADVVPQIVGGALDVRTLARIDAVAGDALSAAESARQLVESESVSDDVKADILRRSPSLAGTEAGREFIERAAAGREGGSAPAAPVQPERGERGLDRSVSRGVDIEEVGAARPAQAR